MAVWDRWDRIIVVMRPMAPLRRSARCRPAADATRGSGSRPSARSGTTRPTRSPTRAGASLSVPITVAPIMRRNVRVKYAASENPAQHAVSDVESPNWAIEIARRVFARVSRIAQHIRFARPTIRTERLLSATRRSDLSARARRPLCGHTGHRLLQRRACSCEGLRVRKLGTPRPVQAAGARIP